MMGPLNPKTVDRPRGAVPLSARIAHALARGASPDDVERTFGHEIDAADPIEQACIAHLLARHDDAKGRRR